VKPNKPRAGNTPGASRFRARFVAISWHDLAISFGPIVILTAIVAGLAFWLVNPAPPNTITIAAGPTGSVFWTTAEAYQAILARNGIKAKLLATDGSLDNLKRLADPKQKVDVGFVQGGVSEGVPLDSLMSLGSISYVPLAVFYVGKKPITVLSELAGKRVAIGPQGSGTHLLALALLKSNGIVPGGATTLLDSSGDEAAAGLANGTLDAAFLMGDSATPPTLSKLIRTPGIRLMDFSQATAYTRRFTYLNELQLPKGVFDFGRNLPSHTLHLIAPTTELVARDSLHPALSDLLIDAAQQVNGKANLLQRAGEFPAPLAHEFRVSDDAARYYKSGKSFLYRNLPFWLASLADRMLVILVPIVVLLVPGARLVPAVYSWRIKSRIYRWYGALIGLERGIFSESDEHSHAELLKQLDHIEAGVNRMKVPLAFADQFYVLREHIGFVRMRLIEREASLRADSATATAAVAPAAAAPPAP
jgi:NMT1-like family